MTSKPQKHYARPARLFRPYFHMSAEKRQRREPFRSFCDTPNIASEFDNGCWFSAFGGRAVELRNFVDRGDER